MKQRLFFACVLFILVASCHPNRKKTNAISEAEKTIARKTLQVPADFSTIDKAYATIISAIKNCNEMVFDQFIPTSGLFIIFTTRAKKCGVKKIYHINEFEQKEETIFDKDKRHLPLKFKHEPLPVKNCQEKNIYNKRGTFGRGINVLNITGLMNDCITDYIQISEILSEASEVSYTVLNTNLGFFYFKSEKGQWKLNFLDIRKPCDY